MKQYMKTVWVLWLLAGCAATPYVQPSAVCREDGGGNADPWWRTFGDEKLQLLQAEARRCNVDLARRALEADRNRLEAGTTDAEFDGSLGVGSGKPLKGGASRQTFDTRVQVSYEVDIWGRMARARDARAWLARASEFDARAYALSLDAEVASRYWALGALAQRLALARTSLLMQQNILEIQERQLQAGALPEREVRTQQQAVLRAQQWLSDLARQESDARERLAALLDRSSSEGLEVALPAQMVLPEIEAGLPAELLMRRPDVAAQDALVRRRLAMLDQARTRLLPRLTLTGSLGTRSAELGQWLSQPYGSLMSNLALPFLNWHNLAIERDQAKIDYQIESLEYRKTVHRALREVETALTGRQRLLNDFGRLQQGLTLARKAESEANVRLRLGDSDRLNLYAAELNRTLAEDALVSTRLAQLTNLAALYTAMGGAPVI